MILVTGGTGLVGSHLLYHLCLSKQNIRAIYRNKAQIALVENVFSYYTDNVKPLLNKIEWVEACIEDIPKLSEAFKDVDVIYHCAALVSFNPKDYVKMRRVNIKGTANMVNLSIDFGIKKFCYVSSIATLGDSIKRDKVTEENEWNSADKSGYAISKYGAEQEVWRGSEEGLNVVIVNPGVILGPGFWHSGTGLMFTNVYKGLKFYASGVSGFVGVNDIVKTMIALTESPLKSQRYILVSENKNFKYVLDTIAKAFEIKAPSIKVTNFLGSIVWRLDWLKCFLTGKSPLLSKESARSLNTKTFYSSKKIIEELPFEFEPLSNVIIETANFFKKN